MSINRPGARDRKGSVLIPCLLFLSLIGLTAMGLLKLTRSELKLSHNLDHEYLTLQAARSGTEYALCKLTTDGTYTGETVNTSEMGSWAITVATDVSNALMRTVTCNATIGDQQSQIVEQVYCYPRHYNYTVVVAGDFKVSSSFEILGDVYIAGAVEGNSASLITGDLHLYQSRTLLSDLSDTVISVDGKSIPTVQGEVLADQPYLAPPDWSQTALKLLATTDGQVYSSDTTFTNQDLSGVVYLEEGVKGEFKNVTIHGVLVAETASGFSTIINSGKDAVDEIKVPKGYYLKVVADPDVAPDLGIHAPAYRLHVDDNAYLDVLGTVYAGYVDMHSNAHVRITGTTLVHGGIKGDGYFTAQSPSSLRNEDPESIVFNEYELTVRTHTE